MKPLVNILGPLHEAVLSFGATDLFNYLKLNGEWTIEDAKDAVSERRKWAQGQRSNPKFRHESTWFIRNAADIADVCASPSSYLEFRDGLLTDDDTEEFVDYYANLGISPSASVTEIELAHRERYRETRTLIKSENAHFTYEALDEAWAVLSNPLTRSAYDVKHRLAAGVGSNWDSTEGLERRAEGFLGPQGTQNRHEPFEFAGQEDLRREVRVGPNYRFNKTSLTLLVTNSSYPVDLKVIKSGAGQQPARLFTDAKWLRVTPSHLDPSATSQTIKLSAVPRFMTSNRALAKLTLETADRQRISVRITGKRHTLSTFSRWMIAMALIMFGVGMFWMKAQTTKTNLNTELELIVHPSAASIYINGQNMGGGSNRAFTGVPHDTPFYIVVESPNFETWRQRVIIKEGDAKTVEVNLQRIGE